MKEIKRALERGRQKEGSSDCQLDGRRKGDETVRVIAARCGCWSSGRMEGQV